MVEGEGQAALRRPAGSRRWTVAAILGVAAICLFFGLTLREGHAWGDDFALYLGHAENLASGEPYADTGYVFNPLWAVVGPRVYPPGYPLLLAAPVRAWGVDLERLKAFMLVPLAAFLLAYFAWLRREVPPLPALAGLLVVGLDPWLWRFKENLLSDVPFLAFLFLALWLLDRLEREPERHGTASEAAAGLLVYLGYATRVVGAILVPALLLRDLVAHRRLRARTLRIAAVAVVLGCLQELAVGSVGAYLAASAGDEAAAGGLSELLRTAGGNLLFLPWRLSAYFRIGLPAVAAIPSLAILALAAWGFVRRVRRGPGVAECFAVLYAGSLMIVPYTGIRHLLPLFPLMVAYLVAGLEDLATRIPRRARLAAWGVLGVYLAGAYAVAYARSDYGPLPDGVHTADAREMFAFVERELPPETLCVFRRPRALALFAGVDAAVYPEARAVARMEASFRELGAGCFVGWAEEDEPHFTGYLATTPGLERVFANPTFEVFVPSALAAGLGEDDVLGAEG